MTASIRVVDALDHTSGFVARWLLTNAQTTRPICPVVYAVLPDREGALQVRSASGAELRMPILLRAAKYYWSGVHEGPVQETLADLLRLGMTFRNLGSHTSASLKGPRNQRRHAGRVREISPTRRSVNIALGLEAEVAQHSVDPTLADEPVLKATHAPSGSCDGLLN
jgi:hypothetical protein